MFNESFRNDDTFIAVRINVYRILLIEMVRNIMEFGANTDLSLQIF